MDLSGLDQQSLILLLLLFMAGPKVWKQVQKHRGALPPTHRMVVEAIGGMLEEKTLVAKEPSLSALAMFRALKGAHVGVALVDHTGRPVFVNDHLCNFLGRSAGELARMTFDQFTHEDYAREDLDLYQRLTQRLIPSYTIIKKWVRPDGVVVEGKMTVTLAPNGTPETPYSFVVVQPSLPPEGEKEVEDGLS